MKKNSGNVGMFISMLLIFGAMALVTNYSMGTWIFLSAENLSNLAQQVTQTGILAIGMTMVILIGGIDLSVGSVLAACAVALAMTERSMVDGSPSLAPLASIAAALAVGALFGVFNGGLISKFKLLPFVVTLATLTMARGVALWASESQSIPLRSSVFKWIGVYSIDRLAYEWYFKLAGLPQAAIDALTQKGIAEAEWAEKYAESLFLPDRFPNGMLHPGKILQGEHFAPIATWTVFAAAFAIWLVLHLRNRKREQQAGFEVVSVGENIFKVTSIAAIFVVLGMIFSAHQGMPLMTFIFALLAFGASFMLRRTVFGRHLYAIGGNREAARLSGVPVDRRIFQVFLIMGLMCGMSAIIAASRSQSVSPATHGVLAELEAIAAVVVGGTSLMGGVGTIGGTVIGTIIIGAVVNAMILMALQNPLQLIFKGLLIMIAVLVDMKTKRTR